MFVCPDVPWTFSSRVIVFSGDGCFNSFILLSLSVNSEISARTNNHIEGWHSKLKKVVGKAHPNVYEIVEIFKTKQGVTEITISQLASGAIPPKEEPRYDTFTTPAWKSHMSIVVHFK